MESLMTVYKKTGQVHIQPKYGLILNQIRHIAANNHMVQDAILERTDSPFNRKN